MVVGLNLGMMYLPVVFRYAMRHSITERTVMGARTDTKDRMIAGAAALLAENGVAGTTVAAVLERTDAPRGSVHHHFPGGRDELLQDAVRTVGTSVTDRLRAADDADTDPAVIVTDFCTRFRDRLTATGFRAGCPVWAAVQDPAESPELRATAAAVVRDWTAALAASLVRVGYAPASATVTASFLISSVEGALTLARVRQSSEPLDAAADMCTRIIAGTAW
jgi:TetR/AcrR family transcriptional repressor of lmrAB and yxaGH operons